MSHNLLGQRQILEAWSYPVDISRFPTTPSHWQTAENMIIEETAWPEPVVLAALAQWQQYLTLSDEIAEQAFLKQAQWLVQHEIVIGPVQNGERSDQTVQPELAGWPVLVPGAREETGLICLSAPVQGLGLSVLLRAYQLTKDEQFLDVAHRVARTFAEDLLDGGICAPLGQDGFFFETFAIYPASHQLAGFVLAVFGLYEYLRVVPDQQLVTLLQACLHTCHRLLKEFDTGYWTREDLLSRALTSAARLAWQIELLEALARLSDCEQCARIAERWRGYQRGSFKRMRASWARQRTALWQSLQKACFPHSSLAGSIKVCAVVPDFPVTGGIFTFLKNMARVTSDSWQYEYLTQHIGPHAEGYHIHRFGTRRMTPWYFPFVWLYVLAGFWRLLSLMRRNAGYTLILAQDGVYTGTLAGLAGRIAGVRVVCVDHSDISLLLASNQQVYRTQRLNEVRSRKWPWFLRQSAAGLLALYWPSRSLLARFSASLADAYLIPGTPQDGVNALCERLGVPWSQITRIHNMIEIERHLLPDENARRIQRARYGLSNESTVIAIICRLTPEKGLDIALCALALALSHLSAEQRQNVSIVIAGDGPLRKQLEASIQQQGLSPHCRLLGTASRDEVIELLGISDIFLYTSIRGAGYPFAILEAMASGCAIIASTEPVGNKELLAQGRGIAVPVGDSEQTANALLRLLTSPDQVQQMGKLARAYVESECSPARFQRTIFRVTHWVGLKQVLLRNNGKGIRL
ncbi:MAG TPA: glycosyltransferase [Ktedonobacteraceae bacterium]|nr:glycosyltransferase [Ktedonobacteraceae bacterium]